MAINSYLENEKKYYEVYVNARDNHGKRVQRKKRGIETLNAARKIEFEIKRELAILKEKTVQLRWHEWFDVAIKQMQMEFKPSTIANYESQVRKWVHPHWSMIEIAQITKRDVHELIFEKCAAIISPNNRRTVFRLVRSLFERAVDDGLIDRNPCNGVKIHVPEVEQKVLTTTEAERLLSEAKITGHRYYPIWAMALMTGMRSGELYALEWKHVDLESRIISVSQQWSNKNGFGPTKSRRSRVVPISDDLLNFLKELKLQRGGEESVLPRHQEWSDGSQAQVTRHFCQTIGVTPIKFHDLRATFITNLLARGVSLARVMSIVGHTQLKTTNVYLRKAGVDVQGATESLSYRLPQTSSARILSLLKPNEA